MVAFRGNGVCANAKSTDQADVITKTKDGFAPVPNVKAIQSSATDFDVSAQSLIDLKYVGVDQSVMEAMLAAQGNKPSAATEAAHGAMTPAVRRCSGPVETHMHNKWRMPPARQHAGGAEICFRLEFENSSRR